MLRMNTTLEVLKDEGKNSEGIFTIIGEGVGETPKVRAEFKFSVKDFGNPNIRIILERKGKDASPIISSVGEQAKGIDEVIVVLFMMTFSHYRNIPVPKPLGNSIPGHFLTPVLSESQAEELISALS